MVLSWDYEAVRSWLWTVGRSTFTEDATLENSYCKKELHIVDRSSDTKHQCSPRDMLHTGRGQRHATPTPMTKQSFFREMTTLENVCEVFMKHFIHY